MIKECNVILNNDVVTVVKYGNINVQFPAIHKDVKKIFVNYENGKYFIVDKNYKPKSITVNEKKDIKKKTTVEETANYVVVTTKEDEDI